MTYREIIEQEYNTDFDELRKKAVATSYYKYGKFEDNCKSKCVDILASLKVRLEAYERTGNTEYLIDVANFTMAEFTYPQHPKAHYKPTDSNESPGIVGISVKELQDISGNNWHEQKR